MMKLGYRHREIAVVSSHESRHCSCTRFAFGFFRVYVVCVPLPPRCPPIGPSLGLALPRVQRPPLERFQLLFFFFMSGSSSIEKSSCSSSIRSLPIFELLTARSSRPGAADPVEESVTRVDKRVR